VLSRRNTFAFAFDGALAKVEGLIASAALMGFIEFIGKDFLFLAAFRAFADDNLQVFKISITRAMLGGGNVISHEVLPNVRLLELL
jgi:hypothetical protein